MTPINIPQHPELTELLNVLTGGGDLVIGSAHSATNPSVIVGAVNSPVQFTFTRTATGYTVEKAKP